MQNPTTRQAEILALARAQGRVSVDDLATRFAVTPQTIRKDLNDLCDQRLLSRVHGGAILTFIDMALFAGGRLAGAKVVRAVTLDLSTRFLLPGRIGVPLDAEVELLRETKRLAIMQGKVVQEGELVAAFSGTLRKAARES